MEALKQRLDALLDLDQVATSGIILLELMGGTRDRNEADRVKRRLERPALSAHAGKAVATGRLALVATPPPTRYIL